MFQTNEGVTILRRMVPVSNIVGCLAIFSRISTFYDNYLEFASCSTFHRGLCKIFRRTSFNEPIFRRNFTKMEIDIESKNVPYGTITGVRCQTAAVSTVQSPLELRSLSFVSSWCDIVLLCFCLYY